MTQAKLAPNPAEGHGLIDGITTAHYAAYTRGEPIEYIPALVLLKVSGHGGHDTANGRVNTVKYEAVRLEPITDSSDRDDAMWKIQSLYESRTSTGDQRPLPLGLKTEERRQALMERIEDWADANGIAGADLEQRWRDTFGVGTDPDANLYGIPGDYRLASVNYLLQFAIEVGAENRPDDSDAALDDGDQLEDDD